MGHQNKSGTKMPRKPKGRRAIAADAMELAHRLKASLEENERLAQGWASSATFLAAALLQRNGRLEIPRDLLAEARSTRFDIKQRFDEETQMHIVDLVAVDTPAVADEDKPSAAEMAS